MLPSFWRKMTGTCPSTFLLGKCQVEQDGLIHIWKWMNECRAWNMVMLVPVQHRGWWQCVPCNEGNTERAIKKSHFTWGCLESQPFCRPWDGVVYQQHHFSQSIDSMHAGFQWQFITANLGLGACLWIECDTCLPCYQYLQRLVPCKNAWTI